jgi:hypothetical protein
VRSSEQGFLLVPLLALIAAALLLMQSAASHLGGSIRMHAEKVEGERLHKQAQLIIHRVREDLQQGNAGSYTLPAGSLDQPGQHHLESGPCAAALPLSQLASFAVLQRQGCLQLYPLQDHAYPDLLLTFELYGNSGLRTRWQVLFAAVNESAPLPVQVHDCLGAQRNACQ